MTRNRVLAATLTGLLAGPALLAAGLVGLGDEAAAGLPAEAPLPAARGVEQPASAIPWGTVGPGWFVTLWAPHAAFAGFPPPANWQHQPTTVFLVDPVGGRYRVSTLPAPSYYELLDWSGDGRRVLLETPSTGGERAEVEDVSLATGGILHRFPASADASYQYTRPDGLAVLVSAAGDGPGEAGSLVRDSLAGARQLTYPDRFPGVGPLAPGLAGQGGVLPSLDGTQVVVETTKRLALLANDGTFVRALGPSGEMCTPVRWWDAADILATCQPSASGAAQVPALWLVPRAGGEPRKLTSPAGHDLGDLDGWEVGGTVYTQAAGACGTEFLARRGPGGHMTPVPVPNTSGNDVHVVGAYGARLALQAMLGCGADKSLFWFDPARSTETDLLGSPLNGGTVLAALPYPGLEP